MYRRNFLSYTLASGLVIPLSAIFSDKVSGTTDGLELVNGNWIRKIGDVVDSTFTKIEYINNVNSMLSY